MKREKITKLSIWIALSAYIMICCMGFSGNPFCNCTCCSESAACNKISQKLVNEPYINYRSAESCCSAGTETDTTKISGLHTGHYECRLCTKKSPLIFKIHKQINPTEQNSYSMNLESSGNKLPETPVSLYGYMLQEIFPPPEYISGVINTTVLII